MIKKIIVISLITLLIFLFFLSHLFKIQSVYINSSNSCVTDEQIASDTQIKGKNLFKVSLQKLEYDIKTKYPCAEVVKAKKKYPNTIEVEISQEEIVVQIANSDLFLTEDGLVVQLSTDKKYPTMFLPEQIRAYVNSKIDDDRVMYATKLIKSLKKTDFSTMQLRFIENVDIVVYSPGEASAIFTTQKDLDSQVDSLQSVLSKAKIDPSKIDKIDLRFDKPVVSYK